jgi:tripartite-type tricarboxylate transporter receptor subunit TctC
MRSFCRAAAHELAPERQEDDMIALRKIFMFGATLGVILLTATSATRAQDYPTRPIMAIVPFAGGSASDVVSRILFDHMSKTLGQPIVVENRPGAGGNSGTADATKAAADGYTIVASGSGPVAANVTLYKHLDYDPQKDLAIISPFASFTIIVAARAAGKHRAGADRLCKSSSR